MEKVILKASDGMVLTDGVVYGVEISLAVNRNPDDFYEITREEYDAIMASEEATEEATDEDYQSALAEFGVDV